MSDRADELLRALAAGFENGGPIVSAELWNRVCAYVNDAGGVAEQRSQHAGSRGLLPNTCDASDKSTLAETRGSRRAIDRGEAARDSVDEQPSGEDSAESAHSGQSHDSEATAARTSLAPPASPHQPIAATPQDDWDEWSDCPLCRCKPCVCGQPKAQDQQTAQPVAWMYEHDGFRWFYSKRLERNDPDCTITPLYAAVQPPIPMVLYCPQCSRQHIDAPQPEKGWDNPPHRSHECQFCGLVWRPADVATTGVQTTQTHSPHDAVAWSYNAAVQPIPRSLTDEMLTAGCDAFLARNEGRFAIFAGDIRAVWEACYDAFTKSSGT